MHNALQPLAIQKTASYREAAYVAIKEAILSGYFKYGQALIEEEIAAMLHVSRTPIREALVILQHEGLISQRAGRGFHVRQLTHEEFVAMFVANEVVEPYQVRRAALVATEEQLSLMEKAVLYGQQCVDNADIAGLLRAGRDFHRVVGEASDNIPLAQFVLHNEERTDLYLLSHKAVLDITRMSASNQEHEAIFHALAQRDPESAARLVIYHSQSVRERLAPFFNEHALQKVVGATEHA